MKESNTNTNLSTSASQNSPVKKSSLLKKALILIVLASIALAAFIYKKISTKRFFLEAPIVIDLDNNGFEFLGLKDSRVFFDIDNDEMRELVSWLKKGDGFLVIDKNKNGQVDDVTEFFGKNDKAKSDVQEFLQYDLNDDGILDASDPIFAEIKIWQDLNQDGKSSAEELTTLAQNGVITIDAKKAKITNQYINGTLIKQEGIFKKADKVVRNMASVQLEVDQVQSRSKYDYKFKVDVILIPLSRGYGDIKPMHEAASEDPALLKMMEELKTIEPSEYKNIDLKIENIIFQWAKVSDLTGMRGLYDARKLAAMEKVQGKKFRDNAGNTDITTEVQKQLLEQAWQSIFSTLRNRFMLQAKFHEIFTEARYDFVTDSIKFEGLTYSTAIERIEEYCQQLDVNYKKDFLDQVRNILKTLTPNEIITGLDKSKIDHNFMSLCQ